MAQPLHMPRCVCKFRPRSSFRKFRRTRKSIESVRMVHGSRFTATSMPMRSRRANSSLTNPARCRVHAFDQAETIRGQGTLALELEQQAPQLDTVLVGVGGGGLISGIAAWYGGRTRVIGVEPRQVADAHRAFEAGKPVDAETGGIAADSLAPRRVGELVFPIARKYVERVVLVEDTMIEQAQQRLWNDLRIIAEPGGSAAFAALLGGVYVPEPQNGSASS